jgi:hypothetical protein
MKLPALLAAAAIGTLFTPAATHAAPGVCGAIAGNLVVNCGFDTGNQNGWTPTPASSGSLFATSGSTVNSGDYSHYFAATGGIDDALAQVLSTVPGQAYQVSFVLDTSGAAPAHFNASWNGATLVDLINPADQPFTFYSYTVTGTGTDTIRFAAHDVFSVMFLDDVSVVETDTPEPASLALLAVGLVGLAARRRLTPRR